MRYVVFGGGYHRLRYGRFDTTIIRGKRGDIEAATY